MNSSWRSQRQSSSHSNINPNPVEHSMSSHREEAARRITAPDIFKRKGAEPIVALTAYTARMAELLDRSCCSSETPPGWWLTASPPPFR
jgi:hypothetical protein